MRSLYPATKSGPLTGARSFLVAQWQRIHRQCMGLRRCRLGPWVQKIPWRRAWQPTPVFLPGESHGQRSLTGYSPSRHKESDTVEVTESALTTMRGRSSTAKNKKKSIFKRIKYIQCISCKLYLSNTLNCVHVQLCIVPMRLM